MTLVVTFPLFHLKHFERGKKKVARIINVISHIFHLEVRRFDELRCNNEA
jgi:hypothetical protein